MDVVSHGRRAHERAPAKAPTRAKRVVQCLTMSLVVLFLLGCSVSLVVWLCLHPRLPAFQVQSLSISNFNLSASQLAARYDVELKITNPNRKIDLSIDRFGLYVMYRGVPLSRKATDFSPYLRILRNRGSEVEFETDTDRLNDKLRRRVVGNLGGDWSKGVVNFNVKMNVRVKFTAGRWLSKQKALLVICKNLNVEFASANGKDTGKLHEGRNTCIVDFE